MKWLEICKKSAQLYLDVERVNRFKGLVRFGKGLLILRVTIGATKDRRKSNK